LINYNEDVIITSPILRYSLKVYSQA